MLESVLCDAEGQKLSEPTLVGFMVSEIKSRIRAWGDQMSKVEEYFTAWNQAMKGDFSLVDQLYHPDYKSFDLRTGIMANIEDDKVIVAHYLTEMDTGPVEIIWETSEFFSYQAYTRNNLDNCEFGYATLIMVVHLKDGKIIQQKTVTQPLDFNPNEQLNWNWEDYQGQKETQLMSQKSGVQND